MGFLLFVKKKLGFEKEGEWMRAQAARAMEAFTPSRVGDREKTKVIELVRWQGLQFASSRHVTLHIIFSFAEGVWTAYYHDSLGNGLSRRI